MRYINLRFTSLLTYKTDRFTVLEDYITMEKNKEYAAT